MSSTAPNEAAPGLRLIEVADVRMVFEWRNDPWIISLSTSRRPVTWEEHQAWFASMLDRSNHLLFIIHSPEELPAGTVRLDRVREETAVVTIYLLQPFTDRRIGPRSLEAACRAAFDHWPSLTRIVGYVRADNQPSLKAFRHTGFQEDLAEPSCPVGHVVMVRRRAHP